MTTNGGTAQTRTANKQNEITGISGATTPTYDSNGNMTGDETGKLFAYDAWNRLVAVKNSGGTTLKTYGYDGANRRVTETASGTTTDLFYSKDWQALEERVGSDTTNRYVWSPMYVDAIILRDRDTNADGTLDERLWVQQDANWNVTALVNGSGTVVERYAYDPYGVRTVYDASYAVRSGGSTYNFRHGFQGMTFDAVAGLSPQRNRWYSPALGRWVSLDPIRFEAGDINLYSFVGNNPLCRIDPTGLLALFFDGAGQDLGNKTTICKMYNETSDASAYYKLNLIKSNVSATVGDAVKFVKGYFKNKKEVCAREGLYLFGWSRGAVAAVLVADKLHDISNGGYAIKFMGLIDPVATGVVGVANTTGEVWLNVATTWVGLRDKDYDRNDVVLFAKWHIDVHGTLIRKEYPVSHSDSGFDHLNGTLGVDLRAAAKAAGWR